MSWSNCWCFPRRRGGQTPANSNPPINATPQPAPNAVAPLAATGPRHSLSGTPIESITESLDSRSSSETVYAKAFEDSSDYLNDSE